MILMIKGTDHIVTILMPDKLKRDFEKKAYLNGFQNLSEAIRNLIRRDIYGGDREIKKVS